MIKHCYFINPGVKTKQCVQFCRQELIGDRWDNFIYDKSTYKVQEASSVMYSLAYVH